MDDCCQLEEHVVLHWIHLGPVLDVRTILELLVEVGMAEAVINTTLINTLVEVVRLVVVGVVNIGSSSDDTTVGSGCSD